MQRVVGAGHGGSDERGRESRGAVLECKATVVDLFAEEEEASVIGRAGVRPGRGDGG